MSRRHCRRRGRGAWILAADFDLLNNPASSSPWGYGYATDLGGTFLLEDGVRLHDTDLHGQNTGATQLPDTYPVIVKNHADDVYDDGAGTAIGAGQTALHPGPLSEYSVARQDTPGTGTFRVIVAFKPAHSDAGGGGQAPSTNVHVLVDAAPVFSDAVFRIGKPVAEFARVLDLDTSYTLDFAVGFGGNSLVEDFVVVDATVVQIPPCNPADLARTYGLLDLSDINRFFTWFIGGCP